MSLGLLVLLVVVGTTIWVGVDSSHRDWRETSYSTASWVVGCILLWIVFFPLYLARRNRAPLKDTPGSVPAVMPPRPKTTAVAYRECPHCREPMRRDATTCPHCQSTSTPWRFHDCRWWYRASEAEPWQWLDEQRGVWVPLDTPPSAPAAGRA